jgi:hypothetical protein
MAAIEQRGVGAGSPLAPAPAGIRLSRLRQFAAQPRDDTDELLDRLTVTFGQLWSHDMSLEQLDRYANLLGHAEKDALERVALREEEVHG